MKHFLSQRVTTVLIFSALLLSDLVASEKIVPHAVYAELHGLPDRYCTRVYSGAIDLDPVHGKVKSMWCRKVKPRVDFFNGDHQWIHSEPLKIDNSTHMQHLIDSVRARLAVLPTVAWVDVVWMKAPSYQSVELYDALGHLVAATEFGSLPWVIAENDMLQQSIVALLVGKIANPAILKELRIRKRTDITVGRGSRMAQIMKIIF